jgi:hypothetical protein
MIDSYRLPSALAYSLDHSPAHRSRFSLNAKVQLRLTVTIAVALGITLAGTPARAVAQATAPAATPAPDSAKLQLIHEVLTQSHVVDLMLQTMEMSAPAQRAANPQIPAAFWDRFLGAVRERRGELESLIVPIYDRHFTTDELRQLLAFYRSPIGQKMLTEQPAIARDAMDAGRVWGQQLGMEIGQQMAAEAKKAP